MEDNSLKIKCKHGEGIAYVVCAHLNTYEIPVGFIENSSDQNDLQAWCYACEYLFSQEKEMTEKFKDFSNPFLVCDQCYSEIKMRHTID